jgi:hypothetical protein
VPLRWGWKPFSPAGRIMNGKVVLAEDLDNLQSRPEIEKLQGVTLVGEVPGPFFGVPNCFAIVQSRL